jgi:L-ascorbate metabolism protein UlaG (beta-lactamase superfamily)
MLSLVKITVSEKRNFKPKEIEISENTTLKSWGTIKVNKSHFFPSSFQIKTDKKTIYIDPVEIDPFEKADYILITHSHPDHFSLTDIKKILKSDTKIICSKSVSKKLKGFNTSIHILEPGDTLKLEGLNLTATAAYNTKSIFLWIKAHPRSKGNIGFILTLDNGYRIYHAGDTDYIPEILKINNIQLLLIPIGGDNLTLNEEEAAMIVNQIKPEIAVPMHYEIKNGENRVKFRSLVDIAIQVIECE